MPPNDSILLAQIATDVKYLRLSFDEHKQVFKEHVEHDQKVDEDYLKPLWEAHQRQAGAVRIGVIISTVLGGISGLIVSYFTGIPHK